MTNKSKKDIRRAIHQARSAAQSGAKPAKFVKRGKFRKMPAKIQIDKDQRVHILCPYCNPPHEIGIVPGACGTKILVQAVQEIFRGQKCALCGKEDGETVQVGSVYRCLVPCRNDMTIYAVPPKKSVLAGLVMHLLPKALHLKFRQKFGKVPVALTRNGKRAGYAWQRVTVEKPNDQTASG